MMKRIFALLTALTLSLCVTAQAADEDPIVFTFNGKEIPRSELLLKAPAYAQNGSISSETAYDEAIEYMVVNQLTPEAKAAELGLDQFDDKEIEQLKAEAADFFEQQLDVCVEYFSQNDQNIDKEAFREDLREYWKSIGTTVESAQETYIFQKICDRLLETIDVTVSEDEILRKFDAESAKDEEFFKDNIAAYEYYTNYLGYDIWFIPEGYRSIRQILLPADDALCENYKTAKADNTGEEEAAAAILEDRQETIDAIYAELDEGADFAEVMAKYDEDPSASGEDAQKDYPVHPESTLWVEEFTQGAFSDKMQNPGDVSDPVVSQYGVHILYYERDVKGGRVEMSDAIRSSINNFLTEEKRAAKLVEWSKEYELVYNQDVLDEMMTATSELSAEPAE